VGVCVWRSGNPGCIHKPFLFATLRDGHVDSGYSAGVWREILFFFFKLSFWKEVSGDAGCLRTHGEICGQVQVGGGIVSGGMGLFREETAGTT
jgi:hypothetical protein